MEKRLRARLIKIYIVSAALIMAAVLAVVMIMTTRETRRAQAERLTELMTSVAENLQTESTVEHSALRQFEKDNALFIKIIDNGSALFYNGGDSGQIAALFDMAAELARDGGLDVMAVSLYSQRRSSPAMRFAHAGAAYYGIVSVIPVEAGYRALIMVQLAASSWEALDLAAYLGGYALSVLLLGLVGIKLIERALLPALESRARQTEFIAAASHELRTPLAVIRAHTTTVQNMPDEAQNAASAIESESARMSRLIDDMLLLASADAKSWPIHLEPLDADTLLLNAYEVYGTVCAKRGYQLSLKLPDAPLPRVKGDGQRLLQVLGILIENALDYANATPSNAGGVSARYEANEQNESPECGIQADRNKIELAAHSAKGQVAIEIVDHGVGIANEHKPLVFERFHRGDQARRAREHFGLGLSIASELVKLHGGELSLRDTPGGGCTFRILLS